MALAVAVALQALGLLAPPVLGQTPELAAGREEVKIEVLHVPADCSPRSRRGDMLNAHYDGYLARGGARFYCR